MSKDKLDKKLENNRLILEFVGYTKDIYDHGRNGSVDIWKNDSVRKGHYRTLLECNFHYDWNELMPIVEKIESLRHKTTRESYYQVKISGNNCLICDIHGSVIAQETRDSKIDGTYDAVILFIKHWNKR